MKYIALLGDSITQFSFSVDFRGWGAQLADRFQRRLDVINRGYSGYTTNDYLRVLPRVVQHLHRIEDCAVATLFLGTNDAALDQIFATDNDGVPAPSRPQHVPVEQYSRNMHQLIMYMWHHLPHAHVVVVTPGQVDEAAIRENPNLKPHKNRVMRMYAAAAVKVVQDLHDTGYGAPGTDGRKLLVVDLYAAMEPHRPQPEQPPPAFTDGLHFNGLGNDIVFQELVRLLDTQLRLTPETVSMSGPYWRDITPVRVVTDKDGSTRHDKDDVFDRHTY
ncbi:isoamyl acetate-hydrolyzing esterase [Sorochytrium milnesiophthora]